VRSLADIEAALDRPGSISGPPSEASATLLAMAEEVLAAWLIAHDQEPADETREGFRLLALHRQGAKGDPSFNACRETCREIAYHRNLMLAEPDDPEVASRIEMMRRLVHHLCLFISGKLQDANLGEFCCSSRPLRAMGN
jgi:hypothetical protein